MPGNVGLLSRILAELLELCVISHVMMYHDVDNHQQKIRFPSLLALLSLSPFLCCVALVTCLTR